RSCCMDASQTIHSKNTAGAIQRPCQGTSGVFFFGEGKLMITTEQKEEMTNKVKQLSPLVIVKETPYSETTVMCFANEWIFNNHAELCEIAKQGRTAIGDGFIIAEGKNDGTYEICYA